MQASSTYCADSNTHGPAVRSLCFGSRAYRRWSSARGTGPQADDQRADRPIVSADQSLYRYRDRRNRDVGDLHEAAAADLHPDRGTETGDDSLHSAPTIDALGLRGFLRPSSPY